MGCCSSDNIDFDSAYNLRDLLQIVKEKTAIIKWEESDLRKYYNNEIIRPRTIDVVKYSNIELQEHHDYLKKIVPLFNLTIKRLELYKENLPFDETKSIVERIVNYADYFSKTTEMLAHEVDTIKALAIHYEQIK